ncbi:MAG: transcriptional regulator PsrA [Candidatus Pelagadaptatus aseana]|uniref:TetR/AcrR family transcriptional regulator n=1 Tax=Candidatus Pelagadaptatus aseana TaxID=3120508 RepID=UPI0039B1C9BF
MSQPDTIERILDAAAALFAERGYSETSLRTITTTANVNLAAVNYHFGSKKALIQAVFSRYLAPFCECLNSNLDAREKASDQAIHVDEAIQILFSSLFQSTEAIGGGLEPFMRLLGLAYAQSQEHLRHFIIEEYGDTYRRFMEILQADMPDVDPVAFYWRLYFMLGATVFTLSSYNPINNISKADFGEERSIKEVVSLLEPSISTLLRADDAER